MSEDDETEFEVPVDADIQLHVKPCTSDECAFALTVMHKETPMKQAFGITADQAALLQSSLDELLDQIGHDKETRQRTVTEETDPKGVY